MMDFLRSPPLPLTVLWGLWLLQALWCWYNIGQYRRRVRRMERREARAVDRGGAYAPPAAIIVAVKGDGERFEHHITALCRQHYPRYRIIFTVESENDSACDPIRRAQTEHAAADRADGSGPYAIDLLVAGLAERGGQKVHNLIHAVRSLRDSDEAVVFTDADTIPDPDWMRRLVHPLRHDGVGATTGYRWLVPADGEDANLPTQFASVMNASVATLQGPPRRSHAWGGSTAVRRSTIEAVDLLEYWDGALSDDYQLTRAVSKAGKQIRFIPRLLVPTEVSFTWRSLFEFGRRQYLITRVHSPGVWLAGLLMMGLYMAGWISVLVTGLFLVEGWLWGMVAATAVSILDLARGTRRWRIVSDLFDEPTTERLRQAALFDRTGMLWVAAVHLLIILSSAFGRRITWAGITYRLRGRRDVVIEHRPS